MPDETGRNPNWSTFGYPGPVSAAPPSAERAIEPLQITGETTLEADVCIVGSGAGGGVIAGELAARGLRVVVLEAGGYFDDADFDQLEIPAYQNIYWRGGPNPTADMNVTLQAGACLGGGTTINWTNCLRTKPWVREQWESEFGLEGLAGADFDRHLDAVWKRLGVNGRCSQLNPPQQRMKAGADALGWSFVNTERNIDEQRYSYETAGYIGFGDQSGAKQSTVKTYLRDAYEHGAVIVTRCSAERILTDGGRASGVQARWVDPVAGSLGRRARARPPGRGGRGRARVARAAAALADRRPRRRALPAPAPLHGDVRLLRRGHAGVAGRAARGPRRRVRRASSDGYGFLIEGAQYTTAIAGSAIPFTDPRVHKELMSNFRHGATFISLLRDHGHGQVSIDRDGASVITYSIADEMDLRNTRAGIDVQARLHHAAGAQQIIALAAGVPTWRSGEDLDAFIARNQRIPLRAGGWKLFSAHQMGTCRMGSDPATSVADTRGELHDTRGVWVGDASAFPTSSGTNPMITVMALAHRTAEALADAARSTSAVGALA